MLSRAFVHDANQCLHVMRLAAESLSLENDDGRLTPERLSKRVSTILDQIDQLAAMIGSTVPPAPSVSAPRSIPMAQPVALENAPLVLLVDDEVLAALMLADHLQQRGYDVHIAHDGQEAFELCHKSVYDAIVTDIRMPRMDGMELIHRLQDLQPETPVVVVSGHIRSLEAASVPDSVIAVVAKPFSPSQISDALANVQVVPQTHGD